MAWALCVNLCQIVTIETEKVISKYKNEIKWSKRRQLVENEKEENLNLILFTTVFVMGEKWIKRIVIISFRDVIQNKFE